jgi:predicted DNA-binding transcriptional regulator YafY
MNQERFIRLIKLMHMLEQKPRHIRSIKRYLDISERSVYRYINCFREIGYDVKKDKYCRYSLKKLDLF